MPIVFILISIVLIFLIVLAISFWSKRHLSINTTVFLISIPLYAILFPSIGFASKYFPSEWLPEWIDILLYGYYTTALTIPLSLLVGFVLAIIEAVKLDVKTLKNLARQTAPEKND